MKTFENSKGKNYSFSSCSNCEAKCCNGKLGTVFSQIILEDFYEVYEHFPIVFLFGELGFLKPVILLTNGDSFCKYLKDFKCSIYDKRPSVCKIYPLSPHLTNDIYIDTSCPAVNEGKDLIVENGIVSRNFMHPYLDNYLDKYINMHQYFEKFNNKEKLDFAIKIGNEKFYKFKEDFDDEYIKLHLSSLKNIDKYFINLHI